MMFFQATTCRVPREWLHSLLIFTVEILRDRTAMAGLTGPESLAARRLFSWALVILTGSDTE